MALILDWTTGLLSPQFHVTFYPSFQTVKHDKFDLQWQANAGLLINIKDRKKKIFPGSESIYKKLTLAPEQEGDRNKSKKMTRTIEKSSTMGKLNFK